METELKVKIDKELELFFDKEIKEAKAPFLIETLKNLKEYSLRPAKRIRAILINYGYLIAGGKDEKEIFKTSIFIELIHNFLLIHDDILDQDKMRRGKPSLHVKYAEERSGEHYGTSMAIVAGDMMEFLGRKILAESNIADNLKIRAIRKLNETLVSTAYGEMFEVQLKEKLKNGGTVKEDEILDVYKTKTAFYTFVGPLQIGAILAGGNDELLKTLEKIGIPMGVAFQIKDDMDDAEKDKKEGQPTLLALKGLEECAQLEKNLIEEAKIAIADAAFPEKEKTFLTNLADYIIKRK